jgi:uncharacterized delta-60 repeat protein
MRQQGILIAALVLMGVAIASVPGSRAATGDPGSLDHSFSDDGKVQIGLDNEAEHASITSLLRYGKRVLAGGYFYNDQEERFALARLRKGGGLDDTFSGDGKVKMPPSYRFARIAKYGRWKVVVADNDGGDVLVARYRWNGDFDKTFSADGRARSDIAGRRALLKAVRVLPGGKILVAVETVSVTTSSDVDLTLMRYKPNGSLDRGFGQDGLVTTEPVIYDEQGREAHPDVVKLLPSGGMLTASGAERAFVVARFKPNGKLDDSWDEDGHVESFPQSRWYDDFSPADIEAAEDGSVVTIGNLYGRGGLLHPYIHRYTQEGNLDDSFSHDGIFTPRGSFFDAALIQANGKIIVAGTGHTSDGRDVFQLTRATASGTHDRSFGNNGTVETSFPPPGKATSESARAVELYRGKRFIIGGSSTKKWAIARYHQ